LPLPAAAPEPAAAGGDFRARRAATQRFGVYAGVRAVLLMAREPPPPGSALAEVARRPDFAAAIYAANRRASDVTVSDSQKAVFTRVSALAARLGWPAPRREAEVQAGFRADIALTAKAASRLLPERPPAAAAARAFLLHGPEEVHADDDAQAAGFGSGGDAVAELLRVRGHSGIVIEVDGPSHFRSVAAIETRQAAQWLAALQGAPPGAGAGVGSGAAAPDAEGYYLNFVLAVHGGGDAAPAAAAAGAAAPICLPATTGARLGSLYRRWLLRAYGWLPVSISYEDYGNHVGFVSAAKAEAFLLRVLQTHAQSELARLAAAAAANKEGADAS
jgi:hypothetical protein